MRLIAKILATVFLLSIPIAVAEAQSFKIYDKDWNLQGYVSKGTFADRYYVYDKDLKLKGYIKWNDFSERYEIYDKDWNRKGYLKSDEGCSRKTKNRLSLFCPLSRVEPNVPIEASIFRNASLSIPSSTLWSVVLPRGAHSIR